MKPGGTRKAVLVAAALAAAAMLAAWWWSSPTHQPDASNAQAKMAGDGDARRSGAMAASDVLAPGNKPNGSIASGSRLQNHEVAAASKVVIESRPEVEKPATIPAALAPKIDMQPDAPGVQPVSSGAQEISAGESDDKSSSAIEKNESPDVEKSQTEKPEAETQSPGDEPNAGESGTAVDIDKAADLIANYLASLDASEHADSEDARNQSEFDAREAGGDKERYVQEILRKGISEWIATLPPNDAAALALMSVECRVGQCRILMTQAHYGIGPDTTPEDQARQMKLVVAFGTLSAEPWWQELGLQAGRSMSFPASEGSGMGLWVEYETLPGAGSSTPSTSTPDGI